MFRIRFLLAGLLVLPSIARAQDKQKLCHDVENHQFTVGQWATYNWTGGQMGGNTLRMAVVGQETHEGSPFYWYEVTLENPQQPTARTIVQMLVPGLTASGGVRAVVMKTGGQPAMRMPAQMVQMINAAPGMNVAQEIARDCERMEIVGNEDVAVPAGHFHTVHLQDSRSGMHVWVDSGPTFAMVKTTMKDGTLELAAQGTGAKSSIIEKPIEMPGLPAAPPPR